MEGYSKHVIDEPLATIERDTAKKQVRIKDTTPLHHRVKFSLKLLTLLRITSAHSAAASFSFTHSLRK